MLAYRFGKKIFECVPTLRPILRFGKKFFIKPAFSGWGMTTEHYLPWMDDHKFNQTFDKAKNLEFTPEMVTTNKILEEYRWRLWNISFAARKAPELFGGGKVFVECGVADGLSSFFVLNEYRFDAHLYDTFGSLKDHDLEITPTASVYSNLSLERTKNNLRGFNIMWHQGYIPDSLDETAPKQISILHLDLTNSEAYVKALEFFYPRIISGGLIIFDDYGWNGYQDANKKIRDFLNTKTGVLQVLPTGQAIYYLDI